MRFAGLVVAVALVLSGCSAGASGKDSPAPAKKTATVKKTPAPTPKSAAKTVADTGTPAPEDLSGFHCGAGAGGWKASGVLQNDGKKAATYQLTVFVGQANGRDAKAMTKEFASIAAGGSITAEISKIPAAAGATQCYVRVLRK